jgi:hypothetical protein
MVALGSRLSVPNSGLPIKGGKSSELVDSALPQFVIEIGQ